MATPRLPASTRVTSRSPSEIVPADDSSRPAIVRSRVVLPQPDGPRSAKNSPSATDRSRPSTARTPFGYTVDSPVSSMAAIGTPPRPLRGPLRKLHSCLDPSVEAEPVPLAAEQVQRHHRD